jgi:hypothetical protein
MTHCYFAEKYNFCKIGINPKRLKIGKDYIEEVQALFGCNNNKNGYHYWFNDDEELIQ